MTNPKDNKMPNPLYGLQSVAEFVKIGLQMIIGSGVVFLLALKLIYVMTNKIMFGSIFSDFESILKLPTLEIVSRGLAYSAGVELSYMLFTPGPDEAIEPLILGLAAALLLSISKIKEPNIFLSLEVGVYVVVLAGLFLLRAFFINEEEGAIAVSLKSKVSEIVRKQKAKSIDKGHRA